MSFIANLFRSGTDREIQSYEPIIARINDLEKEFEALSLDQLKGKTAEFKERLKGGEMLNDLLPESFAAVREAAKRTLGQRHYDVQLIGGIVLHQGKIAEMRTGEGKTLVATLPTYLNALEGKGVHIVTVNDYLARRDAVWMGQIHAALGLSVGCIAHESGYVYDSKHSGEWRVASGELKTKNKEQKDELDQERDEVGAFHVVHEFLRPVNRKEAYGADVTYGTNNQFGFDYLRDNMVYGVDQMVQRSDDGHSFAIVDEVDSILIDEARTPLIIAAPDSDSGKLYETFAKIAPKMVSEQDYTLDEKLKAVSITDEGITKVEKVLGIANIYEEGGVRYVHHLEQALRAEIIFKRDKDYVVKNGEVIIVDEFTGRLMPGRRWSDGLHQAVEAKEGVLVQKESRTMATITFQNYFRLYKKLAGMTGTAQTSAEEFHKVYNLPVVSVPTNKPNIRQDLPDRIYKTQAGKLRAIVAEVKARHERGQPVLIGTVSIAKNEDLAALLSRVGVKYQLLNAKNHEQEGEIIAQAGRQNAVTVATNMAGRGVDIILGGNPADQAEAEKVRALGGLHVIGTERHEARRIDNQLRGRAGRQGDPGSTQFFLSAEDDIMRVFGGDRFKSIMDTLGVGEDDVIEHRMVSRSIEQAQTRIEGHMFDTRKHVLEYDDVMNRHREAVYRMRYEAVTTDDVKEKIESYLDEVVEGLIRAHTGSEGEWDTKGLSDNLRSLLNTARDFTSELEPITQERNSDKLLDKILEIIDYAYTERETNLGLEQMRRLEKMLTLRTIDEIWVDHLETMEHLRQSVGLRGYGQRDPLVEYKIEAQHLYSRLLETIKSQIVHLLFRVELTIARAPMMQGKEVSNDPSTTLGTSQGAVDSGQNKGSQSGGHELGRNDPCWCGSGKKYKKCHGK